MKDTSSIPSKEWEKKAIRHTILLTGTVLLAQFALFLRGFIAAKFLGRPANLFNSLCVAAFGLLVWRPSLLVDTSFQLTFAATAGIALLTTPFDEALGSIRWKWLRSSLAVTMAAEVGVIPILAVTFQSVPWLTMLLGLPFLPVMFVVQMALSVLLLAVPDLVRAFVIGGSVPAQRDDEGIKNSGH